jgi:hypothetical protein
MLNFFSNKTNDNKIYDFNKNIFNNTNDQTYLIKSTAATIKMRREYLAFLVNVFKLLLVLGLHS